MDYSVRKADATSDQEDVLRFRDACLGGGDRRPRHRWYYVDNPGGEGALFLLDVATAAGGRAIVGCAGLGGRAFHRDDTPLRAAALINLVVSAEHRTLFPALRLERAVREYAREHYDFLYGFPNDLAVGVLRRVGCRDMGPLTRHLRVLHFEPYLSRRGYPSVVARRGGSLLDLLARGMELARRARVPGALALEWPSSIDARFDRLWLESRGAHALIGDRSADFLRWRFGRRPGRPGRIAALVRRGSAEIRAYAALVAKEDDVARVEDFLAASEKELGMLLDLVIPQLRREGFAAVEVHFFGAKSIGEVFRSHGFLSRGGLHVVVDLGKILPCDPGILADPENWYLTTADDEA